MSKTKATLRLTTGQATVKYLQAQFSERDGKSRRLIPAVFGIFGHGNVAGLGQALFEYGGELPYRHAAPMRKFHGSPDCTTHDR